MVPEGLIREEDCFAHKFFTLRGTTLRPTHWCRTHRAFCTLDKDSDVETAGMPCQPNSRAGNRKMQEDPRFTCYLPWAKHHIQMKTPLIILENVQVHDSGIHSDAIQSTMVFIWNDIIFLKLSLNHQFNR